MNTILTSRFDDDVPPGIKRAAEMIEYGRRETDHTPRVPSWRELGAVVALVSMAYTVGYNWRELSALHTDYDKHVVKTEEEHRTFMPREVADGQYREIQRQLTEINRLLERADRKR